MNQILFGDNSHNPINDGEYDHEDDIINSKYYSLINRIKNECVKKCRKIYEWWILWF